jgi:hypothetical protein
VLSALHHALPQPDGLIGTAFGFFKAGPVGDLIKAITEQRKVDDVALSAYWRSITRQISENLSKQDVKPVLIIDEFSNLVDKIIRHGGEAGLKDAETLLDTLRAWRGQGQGMSMLLTGSVGIIGLARRHGLPIDGLSDLKAIDVPELTAAEARAFVHAATNHDRWTEAHTEALMAEVGAYYPSFLVNALLEIGPEDPIPVKDFPALFAQQIRPNHQQDFYEQFDRRMAALKEDGPTLYRPLVLPVLTAVMNAETAWVQDEWSLPQTVTHDQLSHVLARMREDGFIIPQEDRDGLQSWCPGSRLVRRWWRRARLA